MSNNSICIDSPVGKLTLVSNGEKLLSLGWETDTNLNTHDLSAQTYDPILEETSRQLRAYFDGELREFDLPLLMGGTGFQAQVWHQLTLIPYGTTISYGELAFRIGNTNASRAVGMANHNNPIGIIVPCHRVVGADGKLTGYAGGLWRKKFLLDMERSFLTRIRQPELALQV